MILHTFHSQIDSIDISNNNAIIGLSNLEGNIWDSYINLYDTYTNQVTDDVHYNTGITKVKFLKGSSNNSFIATFDDGTIALHSIDEDLTINKDHYIIKAHENSISSVAIDNFSNEYIATSSWDGSIKIWNVNDLKTCNKPVHTVIDAHHKPINEITYHPINMNMITSIGQDGFLRIWDTNQLSHQDTGCVQIQNFMQPIASILCSPHSEYQLFLGFDNGQIISYDLRYQSYTYQQNINKIHKYRIKKLECIPTDDDILLSASDDSTIAALNMQDISNNSIISSTTIYDRLICHKDSVTDLSVQPLITNHQQEDNYNDDFITIDDDSNNSKYYNVLYSVSYDKTIQKHLFNLDTKRFQNFD